MARKAKAEAEPAKDTRTVIDLDGKKTTGPSRLWFKLDDDEAGAEMVLTAKAIETEQAPRREQMLRQARVYSNRWLGSLYDLGAALADRRPSAWNVCQASVSTGHSMVCRSGVNVTLETSDAEHSLQRSARDATRWLYGVWEENAVATEVAPTCWDDSAVCDVGVAVARVVKKRLKIERVFPDEVIVSDVEALWGARALHQAFVKRYLPKHVVMDLWGNTEEKTNAILFASVEVPGNATGYAANMIPVYEGWAKDGKHVVAIEGCTLEVEPWKFDFLPLVPMYVERPMAGFYGRGFVKQLFGYQVELFLLGDAIREHVRLLAAAKWVIESGSGVDPDDLDNEIAGVLSKNKGADDPHLLVGPVVPKDLLEERQRTYDNALQEIGLNQWSVSGQEPKERSGVGMEIARDKERGRILTPGQNFEDWHVRLAKVCFALGELTAGEVFNGRGPADKDLRGIDFAKVAKFLKDKPWRLKLFPVSVLPEEPQAKRDAIEKWLEIGLITAPMAVSLMELPDVDQEASLISSSRELIDWVVEEILEKGENGYHPPEEMMDLRLGMQRVAAAWNKARMQNVEVTKLDILQRWVTEAARMMKPPTPPVQVEQRPGVGLAAAQAEPVNVEGAPPGVPAAPAALPMAPPPAPAPVMAPGP